VFDMDVESKKKVDITPDASLLPKIGFSGYRVSEALAEFIDNSIDAKVDEQKAVSISIIIKKDAIIIQDNASGMDFNELVNALRLAYTDNRKKKLGRFGLGMKTAATSLGRMFEVKTTRSENSKWYKIQYDEDEWLKSDSWESEILTEPKKIKGKHGTVISIGKVKYTFYPNLITNVKKQLSLKFGPFLENKEVEIKLNTVYLKSFPVDFIKNTKKSIEIALGEDKKITGWYAFLKERQGQQYGFNLFKNGRLIEAFKKIGFRPHPEIALLYGHLNLDFVPVTHNKREFIKSSNEYIEAKTTIRKFIKNNRIYSKSRELSKRASLSGLEKRIKKQLSLLEMALKKTSELKKVSEIDIKSELGYESAREELTLSQNGFLLDRINEGKTFKFEIEGEEFIASFGFLPLGKETKWLKYFVEGNKITVLINTDFPLFSMVKNYRPYSLILVAEAISEFIVKRMKINAKAMLKIRNMILRKAGEIQKDIDNKREREIEIKRLKERIRRLKEEK